MTEEVWMGTWRPHRPRGPIMALYSSPGPKYLIPPTTGFMKHTPTKLRAPAYSFRGAPMLLAENCSPGPRYNTIGKASQPSFSIKGRSKLGGFSDDLHKVTLTKPCAPAVTFGIKHSDYMTPLLVDVE
ncbi:ODF3 isoform 4 [Pan troglodytes]|uniref:ODF3 isoform 4 n=1 Tax=Pan troglodytes TaxID=9598 RepID=A0A2J8JW76_PANTR|nr:ODF3 isoform 4 [Pan troglodytes]